MKKHQVQLFTIGALFFVFGFITWLNSILMPFLKTVCNLTDFQASFVPFAFYISYAVMAIPSSIILKKTGFVKGMSLGLIVMAIGSLLFVPAAMTQYYLLFLVGLFVQGAGLALLQTASNPYVTILGPIESAAQRISVMGICNKVAAIMGVTLLFMALFGGLEELSISLANTTDALQRQEIIHTIAQRIIPPYLFIAAGLIGLVFFIQMSKLPEIQEEEGADHASHSSIFSYPYLWFGVAAIFLYVGAEVISIDYLMTYGDYLEVSKEASRNFIVFALLSFVAGYFVGIATVPKLISQRIALCCSTILAMALVVVATNTTGIVSAYTIIGLSFANAMMWPAIWPLSIHDLGKHTKLGSAFLIMAIGGGALVSLVFGELSDNYNIQMAYWILIPCYAYILLFATCLSKIKKKSK